MWEHEDAIRVTTRRSRIVKVDDSQTQQRVDVKGLKNEEPKKIWRPQDFGFSSNPPPDCDGVMIQMGSRSDRTLYMDGGHEKYRPKNTPQGGSVLFNHTGDIIRVFKDKLDVVHQKTINIKIGKGYNVGGSGQSAPGGLGGAGGAGLGGAGAQQPDDASKPGDANISIVANQNSIIITFKDTSVKLESGKATVTAATVVVDSKDIRLGGEAAQTPIGLCDGSCSQTTKAI